MEQSQAETKEFKMEHEKIFDTKYGKVGMCVDPTSDTNVITKSQPSMKVGAINASNIHSNCIDMNEADFSIEGLDVDVDPNNTFGLSSKKYVVEKVYNHANNINAHAELFQAIEEKFSDLFTAHGKIKVYSLTEPKDNGNILYASRKYVVNGDVDNPYYVVISKNKNLDIDSRLSAIEARIDSLESK